MNTAKVQLKPDNQNSDTLTIVHSALSHKEVYYVEKAEIQGDFVYVECMDENSIDDVSFTITKHIHVQVLLDFIDVNYRVTHPSDTRKNCQYLIENLDEVVTDFLNRKVVCNA
jgi:hypothetical protein